MRLEGDSIILTCCHAMHVYDAVRLFLTRNHGLASAMQDPMNKEIC